MHRRTVLRGAGVAVALPWLERMSSAAPGLAQSAPTRLCCVMFPYGVAVPKDKDPARKWGWFPEGEGKDYQLTKVLEPLEPLMNDVSIFHGLSQR